MAEDVVTRSEFNGLKETITEIKTDIKEKNKESIKEMLDMRDSKIRTELKLEEIQKSQRASDAKATLMMKGIEDLKNKPFIAWTKMKTAWKICIGTVFITLTLTYAFGSYMTFIKMFGK